MELWKLFSGMRKVADVFSVFPEESGRGRRKGFAFIRFYDKVVVKEVLKLDKEFYIHGTKLMIRAAKNSRNNDRNENSHMPIRGQRSYAQIVKDGSMKNEEGTRRGRDKKGSGSDNMEAPWEVKKNTSWPEWVQRSLVVNCENLKQLRRFNHFCFALGLTA